MKKFIEKYTPHYTGTMKRGLIIAALCAFCIASVALISKELPSIISVFFEFLGPLWPILVWHGCWALSAAIMMMSSDQSRSKSLADLEFIGTFAPVVGVAGTVAGLMITFWYLMPMVSGTMDSSLLGQSFKQVIGGSFKAFGSSLLGYLICLFCAHCIKFTTLRNNDAETA